MQINFDALKIYTKDTAVMFNFLSSIFDVEMIKSTLEHIRVKINSTHFDLIQTKKTSLSKKAQFSFSVDSAEDLEQIIQSLEFYQYRETDQKLNYSMQESVLTFSDPDGRIWEFTTVDHISSLIAAQTNSALDVRNC